MSHGEPKRTWSDADNAALTKLWEAGESSTDIAAAIGRTRNAVVQRAGMLGLKRRIARNRGRGAAISGAPIAPLADMLRPETASQSAAWSDIQFQDDKRAMRAEAPLRGLPPVNSSVQSSCAAVAAE